MTKDKFKQSINGKWLIFGAIVLLLSIFSTNPALGLTGKADSKMSQSWQEERHEPGTEQFSEDTQMRLRRVNG